MWIFKNHDTLHDITVSLRLVHEAVGPLYVTMSSSKNAMQHVLGHNNQLQTETCYQRKVQISHSCILYATVNTACFLQKKNFFWFVSSVSLLLCFCNTCYGCFSCSSLPPSLSVCRLQRLCKQRWMEVQDVATRWVGVCLECTLFFVYESHPLVVLSPSSLPIPSHPSIFKFLLLGLFPICLFLEKYGLIATLKISNCNP